MGRGPQHRRRALASLMVGALGVTACSVSTPRNGDVALEAPPAPQPGAASTTVSAPGPSTPGAAASSAAGSTGGPSTASAFTPTSGGSAEDTAGGTSTTVAATATSPAAAAGGVAVGVTDTTITLSVVGSFSGPYSAIYEQQHRAAALTWRDEVNANGGIHGRKIVLRKVDDRFSVEGSVAACKEIESNGSFAAFTQSMFPSGLACLDAARIPAHQNLIQERNPESLGWTYVRAIKSSGGDGATLARFVASPRGLARAGHKIGLIYTTDNPAAVAAATPFVAEAKARGLSVHAEKIVVNQASFTAELQRLRQAGVDTVVMICVFEAVGILRDAKAIAYDPTWTGMFFNADEVSAGGAQLFQGIKAPRMWAAANTPGFRAYQQTVAEHGETTGATTTNWLSYASLLSMQRALELAGPNLTREGFLSAYDRINGFNAKGVPPVSFAPGRIVGTEASFPLQCCNSDNTWKSLGPSSDFR